MLLNGWEKMFYPVCTFLKLKGPSPIFACIKLFSNYWALLSVSAISRKWEMGKLSPLGANFKKEEMGVRQFLGKAADA